MIKKGKTLFSIIILFLLAAAIISGLILLKQKQDIREKASESLATIYLEPKTKDVNKGDLFSFKVLLNSNDDHVTGIDFQINFEPDKFRVTSVTRGKDSNSLDQEIINNYDNQKGQISYAVYTLNKEKAIYGNSLEIAEINLQVLENAKFGESFFSFDPSTAGSAVDRNINVITQSIPSTITIVENKIDSDSIGGEGEPNSCGGTCGSNYNCKANFFCFEGYCKNPVCPEEADCECPDEVVQDSQPTSQPTPTPTTQRTSSPTASPTAAAAFGSYNQTSLSKGDDSTPIPIPNGLDATTPKSESKTFNKLVYLLGFLLLVGMVYFGYMTIKSAREKPKIIHPENL